jgi:Winged helix DNA-binding domain
MTDLEIVRRRLFNHSLSVPQFKKPEDVVKWLGAVQAQDYPGAKWALGLRAQGLKDTAIEQAFNTGKILRTHLLRPTWHFVTPADIRWMLALTAPRVNAISATYYRKLELDDAIFSRSNNALAKALQGNNQLTRQVLRFVLQQAGIIANNLRFAYLLMRAELDGVICSGPRQGKQFTYSLLAERAPKAKSLKRDEALAELIRRYFTSHGPATLADFVKWSSLTTTEARAGLESVRSELSHESVEGKTYWFAGNGPAVKRGAPVAYLLPAYDEYCVAYKDYSLTLDPVYYKQAILGNALVVDGRSAGIWKRTYKDGEVVITSWPFNKLTATEERALTSAARRYGEFLELPVTLS